MATIIVMEVATSLNQANDSAYNRSTPVLKIKGAEYYAFCE